MAFGLFKKKKFADLIINGGTIYTLDAELPEAEAVAVKDGKILAVGAAEDIKGLMGPDTLVKDLQGAFLTPGFTELNELCAEEITKGLFAPEDAETKEESSGTEERESSETGEEAPEENEEPSEEDEEAENPAEAEQSEEDIKETELYNSALLKRHEALAAKYIERGVTSVLSLEKDRFAEAYTSFLAEQLTLSEPLFRYFGSFALTKPADVRSVLYFMQRRAVTCTELGGAMEENFIDIFLKEDPEDAAHMSEDYLRELLEELASHGFNARVNAAGKNSALTALNIAGELSASYEKVSFIVSHGEELSEAELSGIFPGNICILSAKGKPPFASAQSELEMHTLNAAKALGRLKGLGSIEVGKAADFAVFTSDPLSVSCREDFDSLRASSTFVGGIEHRA